MHTVLEDIDLLLAPAPDIEGLYDRVADRYEQFRAPEPAEKNDGLCPIRPSQFCNCDGFGIATPSVRRAFHTGTSILFSKDNRAAPDRKDSPCKRCVNHLR